MIFLFYSLIFPSEVPNILLYFLHRGLPGGCQGVRRGKPPMNPLATPCQPPRNPKATHYQSPRKKEPIMEKKLFDVLLKVADRSYVWLQFFFVYTYNENFYPQIKYKRGKRYRLPLLCFTECYNL